MSAGGNVSILGGHIIGHSQQKKKIYMNMCPIPKVFREIELSHRNFQIVDKHILGIVSNIGIYFSSEKVVQFN